MSTKLTRALLIVAPQVGEFSRGDTSIQITGLKPGNYYNIRVLATNSAKFTSLGPLIRLRTTPSPKADTNAASVPGGPAGDTEPAAVRTTSTPFEAALPSPIVREFSGPQQQTKKTVTGRRNSPATPSGEQPNNGQAIQTTGSDDDESSETIIRLTERLDFLRNEVQRTDRETNEEEQESKRFLAELTKERDGLKQVLKEKEEASSELRRHGNHLDKLNRIAQSKKAAKEKQLQQKKADRQKIRDDTARWDRETNEMKRDTEDMEREKANVITAKNKEVADMRKVIAEDITAIKSLEEEIRIIGIQIKLMERDREKLSNGESEEHERSGSDREHDQEWEAKVQAIQAQLGSFWQAVQHAELEKQQAEEHLNWWLTKRARNPEQFAPITSLELASSIQRSRSRRSRQNSSRASTMSSLPANYQSAPVSFHNSVAISPPFAAASPFFNMNNGMTVPPGSERTGLLQTEAEMLTGGGPMSPIANSLLPSNLFRDEDVIAQRFNDTAGHEPSGTTNSDSFLGHVVSNSDASAHGPHTPISTGSRAGSLFSSPHESLHNLHGYQSRPDPFVEGESHLINPTSAPFQSTIVADSNPLATSRLANLFSSTFNRQRVRPSSHEPPLLGTLKQGQSQSFPRNLEQDQLDPGGSRRRRGSHGNWVNPMAGLLSRDVGNPEASGLIIARTGSGRRSRLNMFGSKFGGLESTTLADQPSSSRPSSTYSYDQALPRPSSDSQRLGWAVPDSLPTRSSPLGLKWSTGSGPWSRATSRRPSVQHGSTSNLSIGSTPLSPEEYSGTFSKQSSEQAPIGTRPRSSQRPVTPRLNPAAPSFKTLFTRGDTKKTTKGEKTGGRNTEKSKDKDCEKAETYEISSIADFSPQNPRLSRDAQSINTATSTADSHDSFDRSTSGTPSEAVTPSGPKETLMQKITRKSSSSKFNVPWGKKRDLPSTPGEIDELANNEELLGKSVEAACSTPQQDKSSRSSISWPNIRRKSRKGDHAVNELIERGSDLGDDDD